MSGRGRSGTRVAGRTLGRTLAAMIRRVARNLSWRRGILLTATVAVGITLLARQRRLEAWEARVVGATESLLAAIESDRDVGAFGPGVVVGAASEAIRRLPASRAVGSAILVDGDEGRRVRIEVLGGDRRVELEWAGDPPQVVAVHQAAMIDGSDEATFGGTR